MLWIENLRDGAAAAGAAGVAVPERWVAPKSERVGLVHGHNNT